MSPFGRHSGLLQLVIIIGLIGADGTNCQHQPWSQLAELRHYNGATRASTASGAKQAEPTQQELQVDLYLESMEDLEHVAYLTMRNFNLTDESLLQSSWLVGLGNSLAPHKQHQKVDPLASSDLRGRLELMLESFIWHLRNGHLRRLQLDELVALGESLNQTRSLVTDNSSPRENKDQSESSGRNNNSNQVEPNRSESHIRCFHLVNIYTNELRERHRNLMLLMQQQQSQQTGEHSVGANVSLNDESSNEFEAIDSNRLMRLCQLAVECHSTDDLVNLIGGPWRSGQLDAKRAKSQRAERGSGPGSVDNKPRSSKYPRSLRESLSSSLAKLCPLMLFQLHDDDGMCTMRRDDRPPMLTVWGFATLFVTIVSFCSLIGLSITPLLGPAATDSSGLSEVSGDELPMGRLGGGRSRPSSAAGATGNGQHQHRACLTLFEGLAVGSLVGSALFSLIPQAFELQERESNQGFLLKALIIFFGIYLFFCSERLMRIILDTRQQRKKKKRLQHRSSNSIPAVPSTTVDFDQHHLMMPLSGLQNSAASRQMRSSLLGGGRKNVANPVSFSSGGGGGGGDLSTPMGKATGARGRVNSSLNSAKESRCQQQVAIDQHIEIIRSSFAPPPAADGPSKGVNFGEKKPKRESGRRQPATAEPNLTDQKQQLASGGVVRPKPTVDTTTTTAHRKTKRREEAERAKQPHRTGVDGAVSGKRRKTRQQLQAAKRRRNKRLIQRLAQRRIENGAEELDLNLSIEPKQQHRCRQTPLPGEDSNEQNLSLVGSMLTRSSKFYLDSSSSSSCSTYDSNDDQYKSNLSDDEDDDGQYFIAASRKRRAHQQMAPGESTLSELRDSMALHHHHQERSPQRASFHHDALHLNRPSFDTGAVKQDISTVAWMIVLGDGLHNFIDGISIGAAFSESILSGVSISVAVICEEFPHELGDFAVLVSSGMTVRQALGYNFLSACTCYFGMAVGIILGDVNDGASYISALAAGVFLYIALVDMMGELSATLEKTSRDSITKTLKLLLLQNIGIFIGISIIFILSFIDF